MCKKKKVSIDTFGGTLYYSTVDGRIYFCLFPSDTANLNFFWGFFFPIVFLADIVVIKKKMW